MAPNGAGVSLLSLPNLLQAVCGALGSAISITAFYPLETLRTRLQVDADLTPRSPIPLVIHIGRTEGVGSLYRGLPSLVLALCITNFVYFYTFHGLRAACDTRTAYKDFIFASISGVVTVLLSNPFWVVNIRLKLQGVAFKAKEKGESKERRFTSVVDCFLGIVEHEGWQGLWLGTSSSLMLISNPSIQYSCYEYLKRLQLGNTAIAGLVNGAVSKFVATMATYPLQVIQTQRRSGRLSTEKTPQLTKRSSFLSIVDQASTIIKRDGLAGLFRGLESKLLQTILTSALMFCIYEELANIVFSVAGVER
mmetsp:Transcript_12416/g.35530  ORF Transcript_12416/g.35530 Transcript_12416/m.35530 type:complete len:308 (+) Transcript_12416:93-1016(+)